jgi:hypothetical protein
VQLRCAAGVLHLCAEIEDILYKMKIYLVFSYLFSYFYLIFFS